MNKRVIGTSKYEEKVLSSKFICFCYSVSSFEEIEKCIEDFKKINPKADHYPYAYVLGNKSKSSDDGEPSGTAGRQFLDLLNKEEITNCLLIVARYFGGSKLGVGRLTRTFLETAKGALDLAPKGFEKEYKKEIITLSYGDYEVFKKLGSKNNIIFLEEEFNEFVKTTILLPINQKLDCRDYGISFIEEVDLGNEIRVIEEQL